MMIDITIKPSPDLIYITHNRELVDDYKHLIGYLNLKPTMKEESNKDDHDSWGDKKPPLLQGTNDNEAWPNRLDKVYYLCQVS